MPLTPNMATFLYTPLWIWTSWAKKIFLCPNCSHSYAGIKLGNCTPPSVSELSPGLDTTFALVASLRSLCAMKLQFSKGSINFYWVCLHSGVLHLESGAILVLKDILNFIRGASVHIFKMQTIISAKYFFGEILICLSIKAITLQTQKLLKLKSSSPFKLFVTCNSFDFRVFTFHSPN